MKKYIIPFITIIWVFYSCESFLPESKLDADLTEAQASVSYSRLRDQGLAIFGQIPQGYDQIDGAMLASATDESDYAVLNSEIDRFNNGSWSQYNNPDDQWNTNYRGVRLANLFLKNSTGYEHIIFRDTTKQTQKNSYYEQCADLEWLRNEANVLKAYFYFELIKRYGGVPLIKDVVMPEDQVNIPRSSYDEVMEYIIELIDGAIPNLQTDWRSYKSTSFGRVDKGMAMALKARALLYWASPLNNLTNDKSRWEAAAKAAHDLIIYGKYSLETSGYSALFLGAKSHQSSETIFARMTGSNNAPEAKNFPVATDGGSTGNCPSGNLVDAYEMKDGTQFSWAKLAPGENPYANRDPRLTASVVVNNSSWTGRTIECWHGGKDEVGIKQNTSTGYYLKKFMNGNLNLALNQTAVHSWILFRYGEVLLNYAEAMNEAYGADIDHFGDARTARWAVNQVRTRKGVEMPAVIAHNTQEMRDRIKHERRIELAFEDHRQWDLRRWGDNDAQAALNTPLMGVKVVKENNTMIYTLFEVEKRYFTPKMLLYPIPQSEILLSKGVLTQNQDW